MEPLRGGRLARLDSESAARLAEARPEESAAAWAFRFLQGLPNVKMILSGMSGFEQMEGNVQTFAERRPLSESELAILDGIAEGMKGAIPCTACRYCCAGCSRQLNIPFLIAEYNDMRFDHSMNIRMRIDSMPEDKRPSVCIGCGKCARICPQGIDVPGAMRDFAAALDKMPSWAEI